MWIPWSSSNSRRNIAKTIKGKGVSFMENVCGFHGVAPTAEETEKALAELNSK